jgi:hypothetical protein
MAAEGNEVQIPKVKLGTQGLEVNPQWPMSFLEFHFKFFSEISEFICSSRISSKTHLHNLMYF